MSEQTQVVQSTATEPISEALFAQLRATSILSSLRDNEIRCLSGFEELRLKRGDVLARQGETAHHFWILLEGQLALTQTMPDGRDMEVTSIPAGNAFGEVPLLANIPNAVNLVAENACHLVQLNEEAFWGLMTSCPDVRKAILGNMAKRFQKMQSATIQQEKMASLGTLAAGLMHELNNP
jgi:CRP-like cAMP-binding protein